MSRIEKIKAGADQLAQRANAARAKRIEKQVQAAFAPGGTMRGYRGRHR